ncbi:hypothetical protein SADUNF_Sadunf15G0007900 [Salix dunnii]|uniref:Reverse transcriptase zinc-binding domain-containing protein n=1 Tax=Salix dunnii TaxID=1413687 RepID=A0A835MIN6_9ROSI|nr:hypothetical protein SADUNF_Sadunf15G0007900 [Salix dunnii]
MEDKILQSEALHYFKDLFCSNAPVGNVDLGLDALPMISDEGKAGLVRIVSKEEVYTALMQMESFKAPAQGSQVQIINMVVNDFCSVSGLKVNLDKLRIMGSKNVSRGKKEKFSRLSSIKVAGDLGKYLGFPLIQGGSWNLINWNMVTRPRINGGLGVRETRFGNISLLGKLIWHLLNSPGKLWVQMLHKKYVKNQLLVQIQNYPNSSSYCWKSIIRALQHLRGGFMIRLSTGDVSIWYNKWLELGRLASILPVVNISDTDMLVKDLWDDGQWNLESLSTVIPNDIRFDILAVPIPRDRNLKDCVVWENSIAGTYTPHLGYTWLLNRSRYMEDDTGKWHWLVKLKAREKVKHLIWLIFHGCLPTNTLRFRRRLTDNQDCPRCQFAVEDTWHCIRDCRRAWERNCFAFENHYEGDVWLRRNIWRMAIDSHMAWGEDMKVTKEKIQILWQRPPWDFVKINVDGSSLGNPGVARILFPELLAIAKGLKLAWDRGYRKIICHSDSKDALRLLFADQFATSCDNGLMIWDEPPQGLQQLLLADIMGISFPIIV